MSGSVFLSNLDDFIAPSQACINPLVASKLDTSNEPAPTTKSAKITLSTDFSKTDFDEGIVQPNLIKMRSLGAKKVAAVSLNDCLACSGCVTSAETVLIQEQSYEKLLDKLSTSNSAATVIVVAISPNSKASIAHFLGMDTVECFLRIAAVLKSIGVTYVLDASSGGDVALVEAREEFLKRYREGTRKQWDKPPTTTAISSSRINTFQTTADDLVIGSPSLLPSPCEVGTPTLHKHLPVLSSHCPGWICYAEKSQPQAIPYISTVKSAQQILGSIMKNTALSPGVGTSAGNHKKIVYFVSIQPCFDKKLESSRLDFFHEVENCAEVDLVLSTTELWRLLESCAAQTSTVICSDGSNSDAKRMKLNAPYSIDTALDGEAMVLEDGGENVDAGSGLTVCELLMSVTPDAPTGSDALEAMCRSFSADGSAFVAASERNGGSGGYAEYIFKYAAQQLYGANLWDMGSLPYKEGRNPDIAEIEINTVLGASELNTGHTASTPARKLKFARAYGFRNIQSILLKIRRGACDFDFIEIMACPSGCNNGGGQVRQSAPLLAGSDATSPGAAGPVSSALVSEATIRETPSQSRERVSQVEAVFHANTRARRPDDNPLVQHLYNEARLGAPLSAAAVEALHTRYHAVPKLEVIAPLATKW